MKDKKYLVTGGTGFIGSALVKRLVKEGCGVRVLDNDIRGAKERLKEVYDLPNPCQFEIVRTLEERDTGAVEQAIEWILVFPVECIRYDSVTECHAQIPTQVRDD